MSDLARRLVAASEVFEQARQLLASEPYDVAQTSTARDLEALAARLERARRAAEGRT